MNHEPSEPAPQTLEPPAGDGTPAPPPTDHREGFGDDLLDQEVDRRLDAIEMAGEEVAAGWKPNAVRPLAPEVRYLHISRTIHQLITDRNRSVGIFLGVASLFFASSSALLNVDRDVSTIVPVSALQYWCLPVAFGTLAIIAAFISLLLIRARIGLIYEVTKMNVLLGVPSRRVERVNPLSIFYLMHLMVVTLGAGSAGFTVGMLLSHWGASATSATVASGLTAAIDLIVFQGVYYAMVLRHTSDARLASVKD